MNEKRYQTSKEHALSNEVLRSYWSGICATPLHYQPKQRPLQMKMTNELAERVVENMNEHVKDPSAELLRFVELTVLSRDARHQVKGQSNYETSLGECIEGERVLGDTELDSVKYHAENGIATPAELLELRHDTGMVSVELGRVTGGDEVLLGKLESEVDSAIREFDGVYCEEKDARIKVRAFSIPDSNSMEDDPEAIVVTRRNEIAECGLDTRIMRRSSYIIRLDDLEQADRDGILAIPRRKGAELWAKTANHEYGDLVSKLGNYLDNDTTIPVSTTYYAVSKIVQDEKDRRENLQRTEAHYRDRELYPEVSAARDLASFAIDHTTV